MISLSDYKEARKVLINALKLTYGEATYENKDKPIPNNVKNSDCNITFKFNNKYNIDAIILGVHPKIDEVRVYNPKTGKRYFIGLCSIINLT